MIASQLAQDALTLMCVSVCFFYLNHSNWCIQISVEYFEYFTRIFKYEQKSETNFENVLVGIGIDWVYLQF